MTSTLILERHDAVQWIRLDRPDARNAIDFAMREELMDVFATADADPDVRAIVVTGSGRDFCTGGDLVPSGSGSLLDYPRALRPFQDLFRAYWELETPVVSAVNGTDRGRRVDARAAGRPRRGRRRSAVDARVRAARHGPACRRPLLPASRPVVPSPQRGRAPLRHAHLGDARELGSREPAGDSPRTWTRPPRTSPSDWPRARRAAWG